MAEEKLNLLQFASRGPTEASACSTQVVRRQLIVADPRGEFLNHVPNQLFGDSVAPGLPGTAHFSEEPSALNAGRYCPVA
jgi:hypothetical protein